MKREELKKTIENGESVWFVSEMCDNKERCVLEAKISHIEFDRVFIKIGDKTGWCDFFELYKTKAEAEHYLHHANITRTERLPFLTWEEFKKVKKISFNANGRSYCLYKYKNHINLEDCQNDGVPIGIWGFTEREFYKAYDECVRRFRGEE